MLRGAVCDGASALALAIFDGVAKFQAVEASARAFDDCSSLGNGLPPEDLALVECVLPVLEGAVLWSGTLLGATGGPESWTCVHVLLWWLLAM